MPTMFSAIWAEVSCEANCAQFGRKFVLRSCVRKVYKFALVYRERTGDVDQSSLLNLRSFTSARGEVRAFTSGLRAPEPAQHGGLGVEHGPLGAGLIALRICSKLINIIPYPLIFSDLRTNCLLRLRQNFE